MEESQVYVDICYLEFYDKDSVFIFDEKYSLPPKLIESKIHFARIKKNL